LSAYVGLLDVGLQTAIGKYVAEYDASGEREASHHLVSTSFTILALAATIGCLAVGAMVWASLALSPDAGDARASSAYRPSRRRPVHICCTAVQHI